MLENLCQEVYDRRPREYIYKSDSVGRLVTEVHGKRADRDLGAAIKTFRENEETNQNFLLRSGKIERV